jgi:hypothetical protein
MKTFLKSIFIIFGFMLVIGSAAPLVASAASAKEEVCSGIGATAGSGGCTEGSGKSLNDIMALVINIFSWVVGIVAVLFAIIAGFKYITSGGDPSAIKSAKDTLLYVIIGLVIVALSQVIVNFVLDKTNNLDGKPSSFLKMRLLKPSHYDIK